MLIDRCVPRLALDSFEIVLVEMQRRCDDLLSAETRRTYE
jgi:hypothetical protein